MYTIGVVCENAIFRHTPPYIVTKRRKMEFDEILFLINLNGLRLNEHVLSIQMVVSLFVVYIVTVK